MIANKVDSNQGDIIKAIKGRGGLSQSLAAVKNGCPDLLVGYRGQLAVFENKPGDAADRRQRELNDREAEWHDVWAGYPVYLILSPEAALEVFDAFDSIGKWPRLHRSRP